METAGSNGKSKILRYHSILTIQQNPRHGWSGWKKHYKNKFTYLQPSLNESDLSPSETSSSAVQMPAPRLDFRMNFTKPAPPRPSAALDAQRPVRVRKPAQREGIVSWSEAVATIASVDPVGNAGLLNDARRTGFPLTYELPVSSSSMFPNRLYSQDGPSSKRPDEQGHKYPTELTIQDDSLDELGLKDPASYTHRSSEQQSRCPHADCRHRPTTLYRLERRSDEELSPMCSHLLYEHQIAPFPCGELNCERKGPQGYFMQKDLVRHVREAHPYIAALHRLRGRVDQSLLSNSRTSTKFKDSVEERPNTTSAEQPRDSDFMSPHKRYTSYELSSRRGIPLRPDQDPDKTLTPQSWAKAVPESASSLNAQPSSATAKDMSSRINLREASSDSDLKILDENPFLNKEASNKAQPSDPIVARKPHNGNNPPPSSVPGSSTNSYIYGSESSKPQLSKAWARIPCTYPGCGQMISPAAGNMARHLEYHGNLSRFSAASTGSRLIEDPLPPTTIPDSQASVPDTMTEASSSLPANGHASRLPPTTRPPGPREERVVDRSYEFSDEEDGIRSITRRPAPPSTLLSDPPPVPQSFFAPPTMSKPPQQVLPHKPSSPLPHKGPSPQSKQYLITPASKPTIRKSFAHNVLDSEDFDELSFGEDGFILLSARPRPGALPRSAVPSRVKQEERGNGSGLSSSSKKRAFSSLDDADDMDELMGESPSISAPARQRPTSGVVRDVKGPGSTRRPLDSQPKSKKRPGDGAAANPGSSLRNEQTLLQTPKKAQQSPPTISRTPLIDLVKQCQAIEAVHCGPTTEIPSTSELGSSQNSSRAMPQLQRRTAKNSDPFARPAAKRRGNPIYDALRTVKMEEDGGDGVVTPGGTLRRCGQDGFACGRTFCFRCGSDAAES